MSKRLNETPAKRIATTIVKINIIFSAPLLVWCPDEKPSPPPNAPPNPASVCCRSTPPMRRIDNIICMYGILPAKLIMDSSVSELKKKSKSNYTI